MTRLSDTQLIFLSAAAAREDGHAVMPDGMEPGVATKVGSSLISRKLMREIKAKPGMPVWYEDDNGRGYSLVITAAGRKAIGVEEEREVRTDAAPARTKGIASSKRASAAKSKHGKGRTTSNMQAAGVDSSSTTPRVGSKQALVVKMLSAKNGVTLPALEDATGWLPHTTRAALTGLRKKGFAITRTREPGKNAIYRIGEQAPAAAA